MEAAASTAVEVGVPTSSLTVGIPAESKEGEKRVAATADTVKLLVKEGFNVAVERGAGMLAAVSDEAFVAAGAKLVDRVEAFGSDIVLKVSPPNDAETDMLRKGATLVSYIFPAVNKELVDRLSSKGVTVVGMDCLPRTLSRAQVCLPRPPVSCRHARLHPYSCRCDPIHEARLAPSARARTYMQKK